jgi:cell wall-associated protease
MNFGVSAQNKNVQLPANWFNLDLLENGYFGISTEKAYRDLLKDKKPKQNIIVAVIDGGVDTNHPDLQHVLWTNRKSPEMELMMMAMAISTISMAGIL